MIRLSASRIPAITHGPQQVDEGVEALPWTGRTPGTEGVLAGLDTGEEENVGVGQLVSPGTRHVTSFHS
jgi:hypothetical protein